MKFLSLKGTNICDFDIVQFPSIGIVPSPLFSASPPCPLPQQHMWVIGRWLDLNWFKNEILLFQWADEAHIQRLFHLGLRQPSPFKWFWNWVFISETRLCSSVLRLQNTTFLWRPAATCYLSTAAHAQSGSKKGTWSLFRCKDELHQCVNMQAVESWRIPEGFSTVAASSE